MCVNLREFEYGCSQAQSLWYRLRAPLAPTFGIVSFTEVLQAKVLGTTFVFTVHDIRFAYISLKIRMFVWRTASSLCMQEEKGRRDGK